MDIPPFEERYQASIADAQLRRNLVAFQRRWEQQRTLDLERSDIDFAAERDHLAEVKNAVVAGLPTYVDRFTEALQTAGGTVHRAADAAEAIGIVVRLARGRGIDRVIKSKSMVSEEIGLNAGLEAAGLHVVETDLGEWLVQLAGERPSHIIGPALHMNRYQTAEIIARQAGQAVSGDDIAAQVGVVRGLLRAQFLAGQMGISGANVLVADTGTIGLVTNEGNAELVTTIPRIHVVLAGVEKLVPTLDDAAAVIRLLVPSATGQLVTSYVSWITGPPDPDSELHVILLDNGRTLMRETPLINEALRCIRCGACSNICPSYGVVGGHVFGYVYSGAIGLVNTPFHHGLEADAGPQSLCVQCNACQTVCPVDIPLPAQILDNRARVAREIGHSLPERLALEIWSRPSVFRALARATSVAQRPFKVGEFLRPPRLDAQTSWRLPPALAGRPFRDRAVRSGPVSGPLGKILAGMRIAYFVQCLTDWLYPEMGEAIVATLQALGAEVVFPRVQHCCGLPASDGGEPAMARRMARQTIAALEGFDWIVSGATSCVIAIKGYPDLFEAGPGWHERARQVASHTYDFTTFLLEIAQLPAGTLAMSGEATYHYFCQSYNVLGFREGPLRLLSEVCGLTLTPLPEANWCCGFGGVVSFEHPELSAGILERKLRNLDETGASLLVTDNPGCIMQLRGGIAASRRRVQVKHTAEIVAERVRRLRDGQPR
ncbi:MAG TPA: LUD domain-containing protein [Chloroflexota bacterium]|nr:LUD domain-containing protein [Chloroflexota bacterium]